ncbi:MAG: hypothetical protein COT85_00970 [Chlamydiae bacterium CG10_big_fil_rev_8_21_14_0_10_42_34]|nr:MAG: hypothetical protein COT85_00970 [Chlamydiae bacterium CG10_big_fil_rev_8_21_14_0_10_42_34]
MKAFVLVLLLSLPLGSFAQESFDCNASTQSKFEVSSEVRNNGFPERNDDLGDEDLVANEFEESEKKVVPQLEKKWSVAFKPGYFWFADSEMRQFFDNGGFTFRAEALCKLWGPLMLWMDGSYFQKEGQAIGGTEQIDFKLATLTLGFKVVHYFCDSIAVYAGAAPRLFMMMMDNYTPFVRGEDNEIGIGAGFDGGFLIFPISRFPNIFLDLFADYSWKVLKIEPDEVSSIDSDVDVSSATFGLGLGIRF